ncbi:MAG TPA: hypothetical protein VEC06_21095 [Paucimonas sp.]|nr:hypothetical protein [Paucimonas sp.]
MNQKIAYCTIASANYLARVEVLKSSLREHNPDAELHILLCERPDICRTLATEAGHAFVSPDQVCRHWLHMAFYYDITEYNTALKPFLIEYLFDQGYSAVIYIDPDIEIFGSLQPVEGLLELHALVLTPHVCLPMAMDGLKPGIDDIVRAGQFNLGFIALADGDESRSALKWWQNVCLEHCIFDGRHRFFVDQFWADILPSFIQKFHCLRDSGYNMAYWNVFQRDLQYVDGHWRADGGELRFFHFSGLSKQDLTRVSVHQNRVTAPIGSPLHTLLSHYVERIGAASWSRHNGHPYSFGFYANGEPVSSEDRRKFLLLPREERDEIGDPFQQASAIRNIKRIDVDSLDERRILFAYRLRRYANQIGLLWREYVRSLKTKGVVLTHLAVWRFLSRRARTILHRG